MYIEILDIHAAKPITIEGPRTLGREGGPADIPVPDERVSSHHARIYPQAGRWYLEDTNSSNGTFVKGDQVIGAVELEEGMSFALCEYTFQVLRISQSPALGVGEVGEHAATQVGGTAGAMMEHTETEREVSRASISMGVQPVEPMSGNGTGTNAGGDASAPFVAPDTGNVIAEDVDTDKKDTLGEIIAYQFSGVPKAFAHYLAATPIMLVNPIGAIKKSVAEQRFPAFGRKEIVAYTIPPGILFVVIGAIGGIISAIVHGNFAAGLIISPIVMVAVFAVVAIVNGFLLHPVLKWFIKLLKGQSDARSRTNYFVTGSTAAPLMALGSGIAVLLALIPFRYISLVTPILQLYATLILLFIGYVWFRYFQVHKVIPILVIVLMVLAGLGSVGQMVTIATGKGGGTVATTDPVTLAAQQIAERRAAGEEISPEEEQQIMEAAREAAAAAAAAKPTPKVTSEVDATATEAPTVLPKTVAGRSSFPEYKRKRDAIVQAIEQNPPLLKLDGVAPLYQEMLARTYRVQKQYPIAKNPQTPEALAQRKVNQGLRDADTYKETVEIVDKLYPLVIRQ